MEGSAFLPFKGCLAPFLCVPLWDLSSNLDSAQDALPDLHPNQFLRPHSLCPLLSGCGEQCVSIIVFVRTSHTSHNSAGCCHTLPKPLFLGFGSLHHGNHFGSSHSVPRWSPRLCPHSATLKNAVWPTGLRFTF